MRHIKYCSKKERRAIATMILLQGRTAWDTGKIENYIDRRVTEIRVLGKWKIPYTIDFDRSMNIFWDGTASKGYWWWECIAEYLMR